MSFPTNKLPEAFEEEHGSLDLGDDSKPSTSGHRDDGDDEDLDLPDQPNNVWLCKVRSHAGCLSCPPPLSCCAHTRPRARCRAALRRARDTSSALGLTSASPSPPR